MHLCRHAYGGEYDVTRAPPRRLCPPATAVTGGRGHRMSPAETYLPDLSDSDQLAKTRERFLAAEAFDPERVRSAILASWWRSRRWNVAADRIDIAYVRDPDLDSPLTRSALPVLHHLRDHLDGQPISLILT